MTRHLWGVLLLSLSASAAAAEEPLTLDQAIQAALTQNASLRAARAGVAEADARTEEARAALFPRVTVSEAWQRGNEPIFVFGSLLSARRFATEHFAIDALNHPNATGFFRTTFGVEQLLFDGGGRSSAAAAAAFRRDAAGAMRDQVGSDLVLAVTRTYGRLIALEANRRALEAASAAGREDLARAERRRDAGVATEADVLSLVVHNQDLRQRAIQAAGDAAIAAAELNRLTGAPIDRVVVVVLPTSASHADAPDLAALFAEAEDKRPELRSAALTERMTAAERRIARAALLPQVAAQAAFDLNATRFNNRASGWAVGGELRWTFSTGGAELARLKAAAQSASRAAAERDDMRARVRVEIVTALRTLEAARARQQAGRAAVDQARESQRIIRDRFESGLATVNDVLRASTALVDAEASTTSASVDALIAEAMLRRAVGRSQ